MSTQYTFQHNFFYLISRNNGRSASQSIFAIFLLEKVILNINIIILNFKCVCPDIDISLMNSFKIHVNIDEDLPLLNKNLIGKKGNFVIAQCCCRRDVACEKLCNFLCIYLIIVIKKINLNSSYQ